MHRFRDIIAYSQNLKSHVTMTMLTQGTVCNSDATSSHVKPVYKFEVSNFSRSGYIGGGTKNLSGSHDHNHVPFVANLSPLWQDLISSHCT